MSDRPRIAVYAMAKNEIAHVEQFAKTVIGADYVVVTDTGSTDGTDQALADLGINVAKSSIMPWRFDMGTNCAMCHVPADIDLCVKLDLDEVLHTVSGRPWRTELDELWQQGNRQISYWYNWSWTVPGRVPAVRFRGMHVHARTGFTWRFPGHAGLYATTPAKVGIANDFEIHHYPDNSKKRPDYMGLLKIGLDECRCPRTLFYYGRECLFSQRWDEAIKCLTEYLQHADATWLDERVVVTTYLAKCYANKQNLAKAMSLLVQAIGEMPHSRELWYELMMLFDKQKDNEGGFWASVKCMTITSRIAGWSASTLAFAPPAYLLAATFAIRSKNTTYARHWLEKALHTFPESRELQMALQQLPGAS